MVFVEDSHSHVNPNVASRYPSLPYFHYTRPPSVGKVSSSIGRSMRTIRSTVFRIDHSGRIPEDSSNVSENLTDSVIDFRLGELACKSSESSKGLTLSGIDDILDISQAFSDFSACSSDVSGELQRLASLHEPGPNQDPNSENETERCSNFTHVEAFCSEIVENISAEDLQPAVKLCVDGLQSSSIAVRRSAAAKLRLLAKNQADNRLLIGESGGVQALIPLLRCSDPMTQEHAVTALLNLSLHESNKASMANAGTVKALIYLLKTGTEISKQNAACSLLSLALLDESKLTIGACGAIPPLVSLLMNGSNRGKKDALTTLYKLCSVKLNKERTVSAGAVSPLVGLVGEQGTGLAEKAMVVLSSLAVIEIGREAIVEEGGIPALVEAVEDGSDKGKEFAVLTLLQLCEDCVRNRGFLVREGGIPPLVSLSQTGTAKAKHKAETLLGYLRESRREASSSSP